MKWEDKAIVLSVQAYGERSAVMRALTHKQGHCSGFIVNTQKQKALLQPGTFVNVVWTGRLQEHLGTFKCELIRAYPGEFFTDPKRLTVLSVMCGMIDSVCVSHEEQPEIFEHFIAMLEILSDNPPDWPRFYVEWEVFLLSAIGFGLRLSRCSVTGDRHNLAYVHPESGEAISEHGASKGSLLRLPGFLVGAPYKGKQDLINGLKLTGFFFQHHFFQAKHPILRQRALLLRLLD